ncbi:hypothetical protein [Piscirickettsia salmonis]|uniref:hypothetical protein n=1 Tax=Piscirickettsia salmonis TaxID=1238 RepID=UPI0007C8DFC5|nr:hypothetical protein A0O36_00612 [Piscirickettsiaceae bacterium NZ-RLO1]
MPGSKKLTVKLLKQSITAAAQDSSFQEPTTLQKILKTNDIRYTHLHRKQWDQLDHQFLTILSQVEDESADTSQVQALLDKFNQFQEKALQAELATIQFQEDEEEEDDGEYDDEDEFSLAAAERQHRAPTHRRGATTSTTASTRSQAAEYAHHPSLLQGSPLGGWGAQPQQPQTLAASSATPSPLATATTKGPAAKRRQPAQRPALTPAQGGERSPSPEPQPQAPAQQQSTQLTAPSVQLDGGFLARATDNWKKLTGKNAVICTFSADKSQLIAKEPDGKKIAHVDITRDAQHLSIQHKGTEATRQLAASAAVAAVTAAPGAKIKIVPTGGQLSDEEMKAECQVLFNTGAKLNQLDLDGLSDDLQRQIRGLAAQQTQQQSRTQFVVRPPESDAPRPFQAQAATAATQGAETVQSTNHQHGDEVDAILNPHTM